MKYLFFDLECSNCYGGLGKICEFGAVLTDDNFNILEEFDIPMNPGNNRIGKFDLKARVDDPDFKRAHEPEFYFNCKVFPKFYKKIKALMEDEDTTVLGYAVDNDLRYINGTCKRYDLIPFDYIAYDVKKIKETYTYEKHTKFRGLKGDYVQLCGKDDIDSFELHLAKDDAKMTMLLLKQICLDLECKIDELLAEFTSSSLHSLDTKYMDRETRNKSKVSNTNKVDIWPDFIANYKESSEGIRIAIGRNIRNNEEQLNKVIEFFKTSNYIPQLGIDGSNYIIVSDEEDGIGLFKKLKRPYDGKLILLENLDKIGGLK